LDLAQYRELAAFAQFGSDLDKATQAQLTRGERTVEVLKQNQYVPMPLPQQIMIIYVAVNGYLDDLDIEVVKQFEEGFHAFMDEKYPDVCHTIMQKKDLTEDVETKLKAAIEEYKADFVSKLPTEQAAAEAKA
jgi:F-type H+-transporting ATPase subunit alpha